MILRLLILLLSFEVQAAEIYETVVKDVSFGTSSRTVFNKEAIEKSRAPSLAALLSTQGNIVVANNHFQPSSLYVRGSDAGYVLILVDGVPLFDASTSQRTLNLNSIDIRSIEKVEIIKGGQSVLYGGQASAGVIHITTVNQVKDLKKVIAQVSEPQGAELGGAYQQKINEEMTFGLRLFGVQKENKSPIEDSDDRYPLKRFSGDLFLLNKNEGLQNVFKVTRSQDLTRLSTTNQRPPQQALDSDNFQQSSVQTSISNTTKLKDVPLKPRFAVVYSVTERQYDEDFQTGAITLGADENYQGKTASARLELDLLNHETLQVQSGISALQEQLIFTDKNIESVNESLTTTAVFVKSDWKLSDPFKFELGARYDSLGTVGSYSTAQAGLVWNEATKFEIANTFRNPSLFHLYSKYGNKDLEVEKGTQVSLSQEFQPTEKSNLSMTLFQSQFSNMIGVTGTYPNFQYNNISEVEIRGVEVDYNQDLENSIAFHASIGYQHPWDKTNEKWLSRRPLSSGSLQLIKSFEQHSISAQTLLTGSRLDGSTQLAGYGTLNLAWNHNYTESSQVYVRVNNVMNRKYEEFVGYFNPGTEVHAGVDMNF